VSLFFGGVVAHSAPAIADAPVVGGVFGCFATPYRVLVPYILLLRSWSMYIFYSTSNYSLFDLSS
jgi:hypothetical protein